MRSPTRFLMQSLLGGLLLVPALPALPARGMVQEDLRAKYEEKLTHDFIEYGGWITDYDEARAKAKQESKVLFVYFSRSYSP